MANWLYLEDPVTYHHRQSIHQSPFKLMMPPKFKCKPLLSVCSINISHVCSLSFAFKIRILLQDVLTIFFFQKRRVETVVVMRFFSSSLFLYGKWESQTNIHSIWLKCQILQANTIGFELLRQSMPIQICQYG